MNPVRLESVFWASEHNSDIVSMVLRRIKISVIFDGDGHFHLNFIKLKDIAILESNVLQGFIALGEELLNCHSGLMPELSV
jgi:hypothetical protein